MQIKIKKKNMDFNSILTLINLKLNNLFHQHKLPLYKFLHFYLLLLPQFFMVLLINSLKMNQNKNFHFFII